ncbi:sigma-70 family RNA polymerase sigma factor [Streptomyces sp. NPDC048603]|uniref:sigma-70 family RNA polymerase sigma factor n=1 Tax=Streptomyces sp. NPDC048603 TaxID=3365577 RepID=UPI00371119E1
MSESRVPESGVPGGPAGQVVLAERFEADRAHLRAVAYRMLGSLSEAEDAVQDAWLRASGADISEVSNLTGWLTTVVGRVCLNHLRTRRTRGEESLDAPASGPDVPGSGEGTDPEQEAVMADSVGVALLVVLDTLAPAERVAFVLHDMFAVPFEDIARLIEKTPAATRQLASRARRRVRGGSPLPEADLTRRRRVVDAFLSATRGGDFEALLALLDPDVVLRADRFVVPTPEPIRVGGAVAVAQGAMAAVSRARLAGPALVDGSVGLAMAVHGRLFLVLSFTFGEGENAGTITAIDIIADQDRLAEVELGVPEV